MTTKDPRKGCTPFDIGLAMEKFWPDMDKIVRVTELVRQNLHEIDALLPADTRAWLMKGRTSAHSGSDYPIIGMVFTSDPPSGWSLFETHEKIGTWVLERSSTIYHLIQDLPCPKWQELEQGHIFPPIDGECP